MNSLLASSLHLAESWMLVAVFLLCAGDTFAESPLNALLLTALLLFAHLLGRTIPGAPPPEPKQRGDQAPQNQEDADDDASLLGPFLDPTRKQQPEFYVAFIAVWTGAAFAVLDWRAHWTEFPRFSIFLGTVAILACHVVRRILLRVRSRRSSVVKTV
jgi:hypothetical protein